MGYPPGQCPQPYVYLARLNRHVQIKELNARLKQMAEDKRAIQKDRDRLERIVKSNAEIPTLAGSPQVCNLQ